jgi:hypothetical protein
MYAWGGLSKLMSLWKSAPSLIYPVLQGNADSSQREISIISSHPPVQMVNVNVF